MSYFRIIAGLGNPGKKYAGTRHNAGFLVVDALFEQLQKGGQPLSWKKQFGAEVCSARMAGDKIWLVKPQRFMNLSGEPIAELLRYYKLEREDLVVIHDDVDLELGQIKISFASGDGGHNGIRSISRLLGSKEYARLRCGVGRPVFRGDGSKGEGELEAETPNGKLVGWVLGSLLARQRKVCTVWSTERLWQLSSFVRMD